MWILRIEGRSKSLVVANLPEQRQVTNVERGAEEVVVVVRFWGLVRDGEMEIGRRGGCGFVGLWVWVSWGRAGRLLIPWGSTGFGDGGGSAMGCGRGRW